MPAKTATRLPVAMRGYDRAQVDALLERISEALNGGPPLDADEVRASRFNTVLRGYEHKAVDALLLESIRELQARAPIAKRPGRPRVHTGWLISWIQNARFSSSRLREGYGVQDVDAFLDRVIDGLRGTRPPVTPRDIRESAFEVVRFGPGYDVQEVDRFLAQLVAALERR
ncbi:DivIVA domain-containing protein [Actinomadura parmotrematis]|uniref:Cell wall synthesis protein Wag31 n=1 Tax=Actinomadura parmotrematis TaxID=2864039 RepID=A0ABS7FZY9_9ACTN|nr:DivIVA domain-containing protein [Actinomadura parmotrematis]MBW8486017.1 DivIVA domain-containing protein [Actinomadura parmotrematis]